MATERLAMHTIKEVLRQAWHLKLGYRQIASNTKTSLGTISNVLRRARQCGLVTWEEVRELGEDELEARLYSVDNVDAAIGTRVEPDCAWIHRERMRPGVTLDLLHHEYLERHPNGFQYTSFCDRYRAFLKRRGLAMRQVHAYGDKVFVDYSGKTAHIVDRAIGEVIEVELFVAVLGASNLTYAEANFTQQVRDFVGSHERTFAYFGGVPRAIVCDNLKSGITKACRYEPVVQRSYDDMAAHYGTAILPARPSEATRQAKVEGAVRIVQRWVLGRLRDRVFHTIGALNEAIRECIDDLNGRTMRTYRKSRREFFESHERATLLPLPADRFAITEWKKATVNIDYHIEFDERLYSVPHRHVHEEVWIRATNATVEVLLRGRRIALHPRLVSGRTRYATIAEHMPLAHREHAEWTPSRILSWAKKVGPATHALCAAILDDRPHPEQGFRSCLGILRLAKRYGDARLERACARCFAVGARSYRSVESVLSHGLDQAEQSADEGPDPTGIDHENVRGRDYCVN